MKILLFIAALFFYNSAIAQSKMVMTINGKQDNILGYAMDPDGTGNKESISLFGPMLNLTGVFQQSYFAASPISTVSISITDADPSHNTFIKLTGVVVYAIKTFMSTYSNGSFNITSSGDVNTELKCKFQKMETRVGGSNDNPIKDVNNPILSAKALQPWEILPDPTIKGVGGEISMQIPKGLGGRTHMEFYTAGDYKNRVASWFDNNKERLLPGLYNVVIDSRDTIKNVPVEIGKQTRLKMGAFSVSGYKGQTIENSSNHQKFTYAAPFSILLPEGTYYLNGNKKTPIIIKDGVLTEL